MKAITKTLALLAFYYSWSNLYSQSLSIPSQFKNLCLDAGIVDVNPGGGSPYTGSGSGALYTGTGVVTSFANGGVNRFTFSPGIAGEGPHTITYYPNGTGSMGSATDVITVGPACGCTGMDETTYYFCSSTGIFTRIQIFEICPDSGEKIESDLMKANLNFGDSLIVYEGAQGSGDTGSRIFEGAGGSTGMDFTGTPINALMAGNCLIYYATSPAGIGCTFGNEIQVCGRSIASTTLNLSSPGDFCVNAGIQTNLGGGSPPGGTYSGDGVSDNGNGTYNFNPLGAGVGNTTILYTVGGNSAMTTIEIFAAPSLNLPMSTVAVDAGPQNFNPGGGLPAGGTYGGLIDITTFTNVNRFTFNPAVSGVGNYNITYTTTCGTATDQLQITGPESCSTGETSLFYCYNNFENTTAFELCPAAGQAGELSFYSGVLEDGDSITVYSGASGSGSSGLELLPWTTGDLSSLMVSGITADDCLIVIVKTNPAVSCADGFSAEGIGACGSSITPPTRLTGLEDYCIDEGIQMNLTGGVPTGGTYSGPGVSDNMDGLTFNFNPAIAGVGPATITYSQNGMMAMDVIEVFATGTDGCTFFTPPEDLCINEGFQENLGSGIPTGGVYSGPGVMDNMDGVTYSFDPLTAGSGTHLITYTVGGAMASGSVTVSDTTAVSFIAVSDGCSTDAVTTDNAGGTPIPSGVNQSAVYAGPGVIPTGNTYVFNPSTAGQGTHILSYSFSNENGCSSLATDEVILAGPTNNIIGRDTTICGQGMVDLSTLIIGTPLGSLEYGTSVGNYNLTNTVEVTDSDIYFVLDNVMGGCSDTAMISITVAPQPSILGRDTAICGSRLLDLSQLISGNPLSALEFGSVFGTYDLANPITITHDSTLFIRDSTDVGCVDTAQISVTVNDQPSIMGRDSTICGAGMVDLSTLITGTPLNLLEFGTDQSYSLSNPVTVMGTDTYFVRDSNMVTSCSDMAIITITVAAEPMIVGRDSTICGPGAIDLVSLITGTPLSTLEFGNTFGNYNITNQINISFDSTFFVRDSTDVGCVDTAQIHIVVNDQPSIQGRDSLICGPGMVDLSSLISGLPQNTLEFGIDFSFSLSSPLIVADNTTFFVRDSNFLTNCVDTAIINITVLSQMECLMNFDSQNDLSFADPCLCENAVRDRNEFYIRDTLVITAPPNLIISYSAPGSSDFYNLPGIVMPDNAPIVEVSEGMYKIEFYKLSQVQAVGFVRVNGGDPIMIDEVALEVCDVLMLCPFLIPTMSEWGVLILLFLLFILGILVMRKGSVDRLNREFK